MLELVTSFQFAAPLVTLIVASVSVVWHVLQSSDPTKAVGIWLETLASAPYMPCDVYEPLWQASQRLVRPVCFILYVSEVPTVATAPVLKFIDVVPL
jgi:hypothetical protein